MNLPHLQQQPKTTALINGRAKLGPKSMRAISQPIIMSRGGRRTGEDLAANFLHGFDARRPDPTSSWKTLTVQRENLLDLPYHRLAQIAIDCSSEVNKGLHDFLRFANPGHMHVDENPVAEESSKQFMKLLGSYYGSFRSHLDSMWSGVFLTGAVFMEMVLEEGGMAPCDLVFNDPNTARFSKERHDIRGWRWRLYQESYTGLGQVAQPSIGGPYYGQYNRNYLDDDPLIKYIGFDRLTDNPYGRPILGPAVYASVFLLGLITDLQRAVANLGISRMDYELDAEQLLLLLDRNPDIANSDEATAQFITEQIESIRNVLSNLDPNEDYVHLSTVKVNYATNPMTMNLTGLDNMIGTLQNQVVNGFKGVSALINLLNSTTETHIRSQVEYFVSAIQSFQDEMSESIEGYLNTGNQVQGIQGESSFRFKKQRTADKKATAEIEQIKTDTVLAKVEKNVITAEEGRQEIDGFRDELEVSI